MHVRIKLWTKISDACPESQVVHSYAKILYFAQYVANACSTSSLPIEKSFAMNLKKQNKPIVVLINKSEGSKGLIGLSESAFLGIDNVIPISAEHGEGLPDIYDFLKEHLQVENPEIHQKKGSNYNIESTIRISVTGRPNTGKSTLINNIIGENRLVTGADAGITRDSIEIE